MKNEKIHFVTGRLAEKAVRDEVSRLEAEFGFQGTVQALPISVAALMTAKWIARHLSLPEGTSRVIVPGFCDQVAALQEAFGVPFEIGPKDVRRLREHFGGTGGQPDNYGEYDIEIIAEINHAPRFQREQICQQASELGEAGADVIDIGCLPGQTWPGVADAVKAVRDLGLRVSIDSLNPAEISEAARAGAELVLSVNQTNLQNAPDWGIEVVVIPDEFETLAGLDESIDFLQSKNVPFRIDPILEPIGFGFARSLGRYLEVRKKYPNQQMMMGIGNLTELTDCDSAGINTLLMGICQEQGIRSVLTTQVINWARSSVKECDIARRLVFHSIRNGVPPKHLDNRLVVLRDEKVIREKPAYFSELAEQIKDANFRIQADGKEVHAMASHQHFQHPLCWYSNK